MRHILFILLAIALSAGHTYAALPQTSTDADPVWYYIQVLGDESRSGRVMTATDNYDVYGRALIDTPDDTQAATQLWRVETNHEGYCFINKATGLYMNVRYDSDREIGVACLSKDVACTFSLDALDGDREGYFNLRANHTPEGGASDEIYLHQANDGGQRDFVVMMVNDDYANSENSAFRFIQFEDHHINYSDDETEHWYAIFNARDKQTAYCITEAPTDAANNYPFLLENFSNDNLAQQWKLVQRPGGRVALVNRASGHFIAPASLPIDQYNVIQPAATLALTLGWTITYIGEGQYTVSSKEDDNIVRYWYAATENQAPETYDSSHLTNSGFAWTFVAIDSTPTGIASKSSDKLSIRIVGNRIVVDGAHHYTVYTTGGMKVNPAQPLPAGIYIIKAEAQTAKVLVP